MRSKVVRTLALMFVLGGAGIALAQSPPPGQPGAPPRQPGQPGGLPGQPGAPGRQKPKKPQAEPSKLEGMLAEALKNNPDIRVAAANLALAEAELNRTRLQVTQKVLALHHAILSQQATVDYEQKQYERMQRLLQTNAIDQQLVDERLAKLTAAKAKLAELEAQIPALLGKATRDEDKASESFLRELTIERGRLYPLVGEAELIRTPRGELALKLKSSQRAAGPMAEKLRKALQTPVKVDYKDMTFDAILNDLSKKVEGLSFRNLFERNSGNFPGYKMSLRFEEALPVSAILQALSDETGCLFFVREYGIVATSDKHVPPRALTVEEFLRQKPAEEPRRPSGSGKNPPPQAIEGQVKSLDASGLMTITVGSDAGLTKGHTLELFRLDQAAPRQSKYLGTIRILEAEAHQAVAQPVGHLTAPAQAGDRVASRLLRN